MLNINTDVVNNTGYIKLNGELDISTIELFRVSVEGVQSGVDNVIISFEELQLVDSTGVGGLVQAVKKLGEKNIGVTVQNISEEVFEVLDLLGIPELLGEEKFIQKH